jgi:hypothetical protein
VGCILAPLRGFKRALLVALRGFKHAFLAALRGIRRALLAALGGLRGLTIPFFCQDEALAQLPGARHFYSRPVRRLKVRSHSLDRDYPISQSLLENVELDGEIFLGILAEGFHEILDAENGLIHVGVEGFVLQEFPNRAFTGFEIAG